MDAGVDMIAPECAVPLSTRLDNLLEIRKAVTDWCEERVRASPSQNHQKERTAESCTHIQ